MKLWLLDADVIIKFLEIGVFDKLVSSHDLYMASSVIGEIKHYYVNGQKKPIDFRNDYIVTKKVNEVEACADDIKNVLEKLPPLKRQTLHPGEIESLAILLNECNLTLCTFDAAAIRTLIFLDVSNRAISAEKLLKLSGLTLPSQHKFDAQLTEEYFKSNLDKGREEYFLS